ncbi:hypothetical protein OROMI_014188 [Orobanche minor]
MRDKWLKYLAYIPPVFLVAKLLDPPVREEGLLKLVSLYYDALISIPIANFTPPNPSDCVQNAKNSLSALYRKYACNYSGSLDLGTGSSSPVHIPSSSSSISSFGFAIPDLGEWNAYQEDLSRKRTRYQSNAYQELENYLTTFDLEALQTDQLSDLFAFQSMREFRYVRESPTPVHLFFVRSVRESLQI